ncbi:HNH endonuclease [Limnobaculum xujianqingii]|uniref:HNH endonuclease n=1 Tax=Limnobaculum xujianqingii TaxID=2738837 RepID=UPI00112A2194|nr:HNH endonuclease [Limnobaculum xujianqingii]
MINSILYSLEALNKIAEKLQDKNFSRASWSDEDIDFIRKEIKIFYLKEQKNKCVYCKQITKSHNGRQWDVEHIISRESVHEFMFEPKNLCVACPDCNQRKGINKVTYSKAKKRLPLNSSDYYIVHPHFDNYEQHIDAIYPGEFYMAKTEKGEKTITICGLNRFHEFVGYDPAVATDNRILQFASQLPNIKDEHERSCLLREIATLALRQLSSKKLETSNT